MENVLIIVQNNIVNAERRGKRQVLIRPSSKVIVKFLSVMQRHGACSVTVARILLRLRSFLLSTSIFYWFPPYAPEL